MASWTDAEVFKLIDIWKEDGIQAQLEGSMRNKHMYVKLAADLTRSGYTKRQENSAVQEQNKEAATRVQKNQGQ